MLDGLEDFIDRASEPAKKKHRQWERHVLENAGDLGSFMTAVFQNLPPWIL